NTKRYSVIDNRTLVQRGFTRGFLFNCYYCYFFSSCFLLTGQEGKLFHPLAYTKTFIMVVDAILVITLAPVLISFFMRGRFRPRKANPVNHFLERIYGPAIRTCIKWRKTTISVMLIALVVSIPMVMNLGTE